MNTDHDTSYWSALDRDPGHRDGKSGTGIYSGVQHFFGVGIHRNRTGVRALLFSSHQILNMEFCAGEQVLFQVLIAANIKALTCALIQKIGQALPPPPIALRPVCSTTLEMQMHAYLRHLFLKHRSQTLQDDKGWNWPSRRQCKFR